MSESSAEYDPTAYIESQRWRFASSMPDHPHEYVLLRASSDAHAHLAFLDWIRTTGSIEVYRGRRYRYREVAGHRYWAMGPADTIINRRVVPGSDPTLDYSGNRRS